MLTAELAQKINDFVAQQPRTIQEISQLINKNWRTTESYVNKIALEQGCLATRTFRGGTRGALKIVYWNLIAKNQSTFQEMLFNKIIHAKTKLDFSPFDIYQYIDEEKRSCFLEEQEGNINVHHQIIETMASAEKEVLIFSGDLSWSEAQQQGIPLLKAYEVLVKKGVPIKVIGNIDLNSLPKVQKITQINHQLGKELIEIRHCKQPLRAFIVDDQMVRIKEKYFLEKKATEQYLFYSITDEQWIKWMQRVFWHFYSTAISAEKRIKDLKTVKEIKKLSD